MTLLEIACLVSGALRDAGIEAFLSGGSVVSIYTQNKYLSYDLDFIAYADFKKIEIVMKELGFDREKSRHFTHPRSKFLVEFPGLAASVGDAPIEEFDEVKSKVGSVRLLTPTYCVMDRLAAYYHWNDHQGLNQAVAVAESHPIDLDKIRRWSKRERHLDGFERFLKHLKERS